MTVLDMSLEYYLAGPMTGFPEYNYPMFDFCCNLLRLNGITVHSPHEVPWPEGHAELSPESLWDYMMSNTRELLERSTGIILIPGWAHSRGALVELELARAAKLPVWFMDLNNETIIDMNGANVYKDFYEVG